MTKSSSSTTIQNGNLWDYPSDGYLWIHTDAVISTPPKTNTYFVTTILTPKGDFPITLFLLIRLVPYDTVHLINSKGAQLLLDEYVESQRGLPYPLSEGGGAPPWSAPGKTRRPLQSEL